MVLRDTNQDENSPSQYKSNVFKLLQIFLLAYFVLFVIYWGILFMGNFQYQKYILYDFIWLRYIIEETLEFIVVLAIAFILRLRNVTLSNSQNSSPFEQKTIDEKEPIIIIQTKFGQHKSYSIGSSI